MPATHTESLPAGDDKLTLPPPESWWAMVKGAASAWSADYAPSMGAALSYYSVFSLAPLLLLVISIAGLVFGEEAARGAVFAQLNGLMGASSSEAIEDVLASLNQPEKGIIGTVVGMVVLLIGATTVFGELQDALDRIWRAPARDRSSGVFGLVRSRFLSFGMILGIAFLLMISLVLSAAVSAFGGWWGGAFSGWEPLMQIVNAVVGFAMTTGVFAMIYKLMPRVKVRWRDVWLGAAVTAMLFTAGRFLIGLYIGKSDIASGYGAAGSLIIVFVWVYYSAQIFLMGAEFTWVYATTFGSMKGLRSQPAPARTGTPDSTSQREGGAPKAVPAEVMALRPPPPPQAKPVTALVPRAAWAVLGVGLAAGALLSHAVARAVRPRYF